MKKIFLSLCILLTTTSSFADVTYKILGSNYKVTVDGIERDGRLYPFTDTGFQAGFGAADRKILEVSEDKNGCVLVSTNVYFRLMMIWQNSKLKYKFCQSRVLINVDGKVQIIEYNLAKGKSNIIDGNSDILRDFNDLTDFKTNPELQPDASF